MSSRILEGVFAWRVTPASSVFALECERNTTWECVCQPRARQRRHGYDETRNASLQGGTPLCFLALEYDAMLDGGDAPGVAPEGRAHGVWSVRSELFLGHVNLPACLRAGCPRTPPYPPFPTASCLNVTTCACWRRSSDAVQPRGRTIMYFRHFFRLGRVLTR